MKQLLLIVSVCLIQSLSYADQINSSQYFYVGQATLTPRDCNVFENPGCMKFCAKTGNYKVNIKLELSEGSVISSGVSTPINLCGLTIKFAAIQPGATFAFLSEGSRSISLPVDTIGFDSISYDFIDRDENHISIRLEKFHPESTIEETF